MKQLPITEKEISSWTTAPIFSPILCADLAYLGIDNAVFVDYFKDSFIKMPFDDYDVKRKQWELLSATDQPDHMEAFKNYYLNRINFEAFADALDLDTNTREALMDVQPWRRRSVCSFDLTMDLTVNADITIERVFPEGFEQVLEVADLRALPRIFAETDSELVDSDLFYDFLKKIARYAQEVAPHINIKKMRMTAHFMSVKARKGVPGNNAPEGVHEDGADFIVSALVINRSNIAGGKSQVFEKMEDGELINVFERELQPSEFLFQADTGEEKHYGNDLWHYVTPFYVIPPAQEAWRNIIGLDLVILEPKM